MMQTHTPPQPKRSSGILVGILLFLGVLLLGAMILLATGAVFFARTKAHQVHRMADQAHAMAQVERMQAEHEHRARRQTLEEQTERAESPAHRLAESMAETPRAAAPPSSSTGEAESTIRVANREVTLTLDHEGNIQLDDKPVKLDRLSNVLGDISKGRESVLIVTVRVDKRCLFQRVAAVLEACQELDIHGVRLALGS